MLIITLSHSLPQVLVTGGLVVHEPIFLDDFVAIVVEVDVGGGVVIAAVEIDVVLGGKVDATKVRLRL